MSFAILRTAKLKSFGEIGGSLSHNYRTRFTPNANLKMQHKNEHQISNFMMRCKQLKIDCLKS